MKRVKMEVFATAKSSNIMQIGYIYKTKTLGVQFKGDGSVYLYSNVPKKLWVAFTESRSVGQFFNENIKDKFPTEKWTK
jgi:hypothetical protein